MANRRGKARRSRRRRLAIEAAGYDFPTELGLNPPDLSGYYIKPDGTGGFPVSATGRSSSSITGQEMRHELNGLELSSATVSFNNSNPISYNTSEGTLLRGEGNRYTSYSRSRTVCTEGGAHFEIYFLWIQSATIDTNNGNILNGVGLDVVVDVRGTLTTACKNRWDRVGNRASPGGWAMASIPLRQKVTPSQLKYMCVSEQRAYVPEETWTTSTGASCECTTNYKVSCSEP